MMLRTLFAELDALANEHATDLELSGPPIDGSARHSHWSNPCTAGNRLER